MDGLKTLMLEGQFFIKYEALVVRDDKGVEHDVSEALAKLEGRQIRLAVMHVPFDGVKPEEWGGGSCAWENVGHCPAGHHENPDKVLVFTCDGTLEKTDAGWALSTFSGGSQDVPLKMMPGHSGRIVGATTDTVEKMRDALKGLDPDQQVEALTGQAGELREMIDKLKKATGS